MDDDGDNGFVICVGNNRVDIFGGGSKDAVCVCMYLSLYSKVCGRRVA